MATRPSRPAHDPSSANTETEERKTTIVWRSSSIHDARVKTISDSYPLRVAKTLSPYCARQLQRSSLMHPTILITGSSYEHMRHIFHAMLTMKIPPFYDQPFFNAFKQNEAARILGVDGLADGIWIRIKGFKHIRPNADDVKAVLGAFSKGDGRRSMVVEMVAAAVVDGRIPRNATALDTLAADNEDFATELREKVYAFKVKAAEKMKREAVAEVRRQQAIRDKAAKKREATEREFPSLGSAIERAARKKRY